MSSNEQPRLTPPIETDELFIKRSEFEAPIIKASAWLRKLIVHRIRDVQRLASWYRGETAEPKHNPKEIELSRYGQLISDLFDQQDGRFCNRFNYYCRIIKKYRQGDVPKSVIEDDYRATCILIRELTQLNDDTETLRLVTRRVNEFKQLVTADGGGRLTSQDYADKIDKIAEQIIILCGRISDEFKRREQVIRGDRPLPATKDDLKIMTKSTEETRRKIDVVLVKQEETHKTVKRIDKRVRKTKNSRQRFSVEVQEAVFGYWDRARQNETLRREAGRKRVSHEQAFAYYKSELIALGVKDVEVFARCLGARSDRIHRSQATR